MRVVIRVERGEDNRTEERRKDKGMINWWLGDVEGGTTGLRREKGKVTNKVKEKKINTILVGKEGGERHVKEWEEEEN